MSITFSRTAEKTEWEAQTGKGCDSYVAVENSAGTELPETGGRGAKLFTFFGTLLTLGSSVVSMTNKRMREEEY